MKAFYLEKYGFEKNVYSIKLDYGFRDGNIIDIDSIKESERDFKCNSICQLAIPFFRQSLNMEIERNTLRITIKIRTLKWPTKLYYTKAKEILAINKKITLPQYIIFDEIDYGV